MGFLHLVFLGFVTLFILVYLAKKEMLDSRRKLTRVALIVFASAVIVNEGLLITQGLATMLIQGSVLFQWLLWAAAIGLFTGAVLIGIARVLTRHLP
jgi:hypothetical protein